MTHLKLPSKISQIKHFILPHPSRWDPLVNDCQLLLPQHSPSNFCRIHGTRKNRILQKWNTTLFYPGSKVAEFVAWKLDRRCTNIVPGNILASRQLIVMELLIFPFKGFPPSAIVNRPGVARAVLWTPLSLINQVSHQSQFECLSWF